ncbi:MAG TPA: hypothetical protein IAC37_11870 [Candidatus Ventrimonas merdavium]|nr:hypothetical protein [Candidatus Ventrimonas merdavium]
MPDGNADFRKPFSDGHDQPRHQRRVFLYPEQRLYGKLKGHYADAAEQSGLSEQCLAAAERGKRGFAAGKNPAAAEPKQHLQF